MPRATKPRDILTERRRHAAEEETRRAKAAEVGETLRQAHRSRMADLCEQNGLDELDEDALEGALKAAGRRSKDARQLEEWRSGAATPSGPAAERKVMGRLVATPAPLAQEDVIAAE